MYISESEAFIIKTAAHQVLLSSNILSRLPIHLREHQASIVGNVCPTHYPAMHVVYANSKIAAFKQRWFLFRVNNSRCRRALTLPQSRPPNITHQHRIGHTNTHT